MAREAGFIEVDDGTWPTMDNGEDMCYEPQFIEADATTIETDFSVVDAWQQNPDESEYGDILSDIPDSSFNVAAYFGDTELVQGHSLAAELRPGEEFDHKIPPTYDGQMSFYAYEKPVHEWGSIATVAEKKRTPLLLHGFAHHARG